MKYERPPYRTPGIATEKTHLPFSSVEVEVPSFEYPISPRLNFRRAAARNKPLWIPNSQTDIQTIMTQDLVTGNVRGMQIGADFSRHATQDYTFTDWFNTDWTWVISAGGAMLTPGTMLCNDVTNWEKEVVFPDLVEWDFRSNADYFMKNTYDSRKALHIGSFMI